MPHIVESELDLLSLLTQTEDPTCGALVVFGGMVRNHHDGKGVSRMRYTAYEPLAERVLTELEQEVMSRFEVPVCRIVHRIGTLAIGDASVFVVVRSAHREQAFEAGKYAIDTLKRRVPIWKNDYFTDGTSAYQEGVPLAQSDDRNKPD